MRAVAQTITSMVCAACGCEAPPLDPFRCRNAGGDGGDHILRRHIELRSDGDALRLAFFDPDPDPFIRYRRLTHTWQTAMSLGFSDRDYVEIVKRLQQRVAIVDGPAFRVTPLVRNGRLWIKDETSNVAGSHKGRHLMGLMLWLEVTNAFHGRLAIASCGNAALAAAVIARAAGRPLDVFVPVDASASIVKRLEDLGANVTTCPREPDVRGDPAYHRFREAVAKGAFPFTCQGNENGLVIEGAQTLGWEIVSQLLDAGAMIDRLFVQVGGGALAAACIGAFEDAYRLGLIPRIPCIHAVQTTASPLARAWDLLLGGQIGLDQAIQNRAAFMWPWETAPHSVATGILDDETYDWAAVVRGMLESGGSPITVAEERLIEANRYANETIGIAVDATGSAGLAGLRELRAQGAIPDGESLGVLFTGRKRDE